MTQTVAMESLGDRSREKNRMSVNISDTGSKKPKMPAAKAKKSVPTLKFLASIEISFNRAQETGCDNIR